MRPYIVRHGDYLTQIAYQYQFSADEVWNDPSNAALKEKRASYEMLCAGDILFIPGRERVREGVVVSESNPFAARVPTITISLELRDEEGPIGDEPCIVEGAGEPIEKTTSGGGRIDIEVPVTAREVRVTLLRRGVAYPVIVGGLDPLDTDSGVLQRLRHLGYAQPSHGESGEHDLAAAICGLQRAKGLAVTGALDDKTRALLQEAHPA